MRTAAGAKHRRTSLLDYGSQKSRLVQKKKDPKKKESKQQEVVVAAPPRKFSTFGEVDFATIQEGDLRHYINNQLKDHVGAMTDKEARKHLELMIPRVKGDTYEYTVVSQFLTDPKPLGLRYHVAEKLAQKAMPRLKLVFDRLRYHCMCLLDTASATPKNAIPSGNTTCSFCHKTGDPGTSRQNTERKSMYGRSWHKHCEDTLIWKEFYEVADRKEQKERAALAEVEARV